MVRTRVFLLYLLVLGFVLLSAVYTGFSDRAVSEIQALFVPKTAEAPSYNAYESGPQSSTAERWQELQERLAAGDGYLANAPADFRSVDQRLIAELSTEATSSAGSFSGTRNVAWCTAPVVPPAVSGWPADTQLEVIEGQRVVRAATTKEITTGSTTETVTSYETIVSLPVRSVRTSFDSCVPTTLIGVQPDGQPLLNDMAVQFMRAPATQPIGYTLDGFTVYGPLEDPSTLDACGGQYVQGQYQYHLRTDD